MLCAILEMEAATLDNVGLKRPSSCIAKLSASFAFAFAAPAPGKNRVHQNASRTPRSTTRCFNTKSTVSAKNASAAQMRRRSSQSAFSSAVISCREASVAEARTSCCVEAARSVWELWSSIWCERTERSSSPCMSPSVRRRVSVTSLLAFISASSLYQVFQLNY